MLVWNGRQNRQRETQIHTELYIGPVPAMWLLNSACCQSRQQRPPAQPRGVPGAAARAPWSASESSPQSPQTAAEGSATGLLLRPSLDETEHDWCPESIRQPSQLFIESSRKLGNRDVRIRRWLRRVGRLALSAKTRRLSRTQLLPHLASNSAGHADEPAPDRCGLTHRLGPARQHQKHGLERIIGLGGANEPPANPQYRGTMSAHQFLERGFISSGNKPNEKIGIR